MATESAGAMKVFICYAREDESLLRTLEKHLWPLKRQGLIEPWHDREITAGSDWEEEIKKQLDTADLILLLVSPDFMASDYCYSQEMTRAMERHEQGEVYVVPIILRHIYWKGTPFSKLQALPTDAKPVTDRFWHNPDEAFLSVTEGLSETIEQVRRGRKEQAKIEARQKANKELAQEAFEQGDRYRQQSNYNEAILAFERASSLDPTNVNFHYSRSLAYYVLSNYEKALGAVEQSILLEPNPIYFVVKGWIYEKLEQYDKALLIYEQALSIAPGLGTYSNTEAWDGKSRVLLRIGKSREAEQARKQAEQSRALYMKK